MTGTGTAFTILNDALVGGSVAVSGALTYLASAYDRCHHE